MDKGGREEEREGVGERSRDGKRGGGREREAKR